MHKEIKFIISLIVLGATLGTSLLVYAHANFVSKPMMHVMYNKLEKIEDKLDTLIFKIKELK